MGKKNNKEQPEAKSEAVKESAEIKEEKTSAEKAEPEKKEEKTEAEKTEAKETSEDKKEEKAEAKETSEDKKEEKAEPVSDEKKEDNKEEKSEDDKTEDKNDEAEEEVVFADNDVIEGIQNVKTAAEAAGDDSDKDENNDSDDGVVFAVTEKKNDRKSIPVHKEKKKSPAVAIAIVAAVLCVGAAATFFIMNGRKNNAVKTSADTSSSVSQSSEKQQSAKASEKVSTESSKEHADPVVASDGSVAPEKESSVSESSVSEGSQSSAEIEYVDTTNIFFGENVTVEGVDLKGKTLAQAYDAMQEKLLDLRDNISISVACDGKTFTLNQNDFDWKTDIAEVLVQAYHYSRGELENPSVQKEEENGVTNFKVTSKVDNDSVNKAVDKAAEKFDIQPVNARVTKFDPSAAEKFTYADGVKGLLVDKKVIKENVERILALDDKTGSFTVQAKEADFKIKLKDIKANTKLIASARTSANNIYESVANMELAIKAANGYVINPGETFSFNTMTGDTTNGYEHQYDNGVVGSYLPSKAISRGQIVMEYGGGICQASTTIYLCALKADLEVVERHAHQFASVYCDRGLDATVDYGNLDMQVKNTHEYPVFIATYVYDYTGNGIDDLLVEMYGPISTEYDEVVPVGWVSYAGGGGYDAAGAKVYFKNGQEVKRVLLPTGSYDYHYDADTVYSLIPYDTVNGPKVSPTYSKPEIYSPKGCGSSAPIEYGTAEQYLKKATG